MNHLERSLSNQRYKIRSKFIIIIKSSKAHDFYKTTSFISIGHDIIIGIL